MLYKNKIINLNSIYLSMCYIAYGIDFDAINGWTINYFIIIGTYTFGMIFYTDWNNI